MEFLIIILIMIFIFSMLAVGFIPKSAIMPLSLGQPFTNGLREQSRAERLASDLIVDPELRRYIEQGRKIDAVKRYRVLMHVNLKDAHEEVEYLMAHPEALEDASKKHRAAPIIEGAEGVRDLIVEGRIEEAVEIYRRFAGVDEYTARDAVLALQGMASLEEEDAADVSEAERDALFNEILLMLDTGDKLGAVELYRERTNVDLAEATKMVEALEAQQYGAK